MKRTNILAVLAASIGITATAQDVWENTTAVSTWETTSTPSKTSKEIYALIDGKDKVIISSKQWNSFDYTKVQSTDVKGDTCFIKVSSEVLDIYKAKGKKKQKSKKEAKKKK